MDGGAVAQCGKAGPAEGPGGFCMAAVGWCFLGLPEALAASAVGMVSDATGPVLWEAAGKAL